MLHGYAEGIALVAVLAGVTAALYPHYAAPVAQVLLQNSPPAADDAHNRVTGAVIAPVSTFYDLFFRHPPSTPMRWRDAERTFFYERSRHARPDERPFRGRRRAGGLLRTDVSDA